MNTLHYRVIYLAILLAGCGGPPTTPPAAPQFAWALKDENTNKQQNIAPSAPIEVVGTDTLDVGLTVTDTGGIGTVTLIAQAVQVQCGYVTGYGNLKKGAAVVHNVGAPVNAVLGQQTYTAPPPPQKPSTEQIFLISANTQGQSTTSPCPTTVEVNGGPPTVGTLSGTYVFTASATAYGGGPGLNRTSVVTLTIRPVAP